MSHARSLPSVGSTGVLGKEEAEYEELLDQQSIYNYNRPRAAIATT